MICLGGNYVDRLFLYGGWVLLSSFSVSHRPPVDRGHKEAWPSATSSILFSLPSKHFIILITAVLCTYFWNKASAYFCTLYPCCWLFLFEMSKDPLLFISYTYPPLSIILCNLICLMGHHLIVLNLRCDLNIVVKNTLHKAATHCIMGLYNRSSFKAKQKTHYIFITTATHLFFLLFVSMCTSYVAPNGCPIPFVCVCL